jgi:hypothetical protein
MHLGAKLFNIAAFSLASFASIAAPTSGGAPGTLDPANPCNTANWQITGAIPSALYSGTVPTLAEPIHATSCAGVFTGNEGAALSPSPNLGYLNDGLLNGQFGLLSPTQFIDSSQLQGLQNASNPVDPGWIMLGQLDGNAGELAYSSVTPVGAATFSLADVLNYTQTQTSNVGGTWQLTIDPNIVNYLAAYDMISRSSFDHLAFSVKSSTSWAVYDFDFTKMGGIFDLSIPYTITGSWTMDTDFENGKGNDQNISHISVWARDPITANSVPEPASLMLVALGLIGVGAYRRRRA